MGRLTCDEGKGLCTTPLTPRLAVGFARRARKSGKRNCNNDLSDKNGGMDDPGLRRTPRRKV